MSVPRHASRHRTTSAAHRSHRRDRIPPTDPAAARPVTVLAFDYGIKRIGIALGQSVTGTATPLETVRSSDNRPDWRTIDTIVATWNPQALVIGLPLNMDGSEQDMTRSARRFGRRLHARYRLPVHWVDERLTTREARERLAAERRSKLDDDSVAAQVILEGWFALADDGEA